MILNKNIFKKSENFSNNSIKMDNKSFWIRKDNSIRTFVTVTWGLKTPSEIDTKMNKTPESKI
tara:strand:+ start:153 stop:341 length:189 start_codon:yes stop_codon:yes gene_type:complete